MPSIQRLKLLQGLFWSDHFSVEWRIWNIVPISPITIFKLWSCPRIFIKRMGFNVNYWMKKFQNTSLMNNLQVWATFVVSILAFVCILKLIIYIEQKYANNQQDLTGNFTGLGNVWIYVCSTLTNQGKKSFSFHQSLLNYWWFE